MGATPFEKTYCHYAKSDPVWHGPYHDLEYGFPVEDDAALFERLTLEINQAGLSWLTILKKREAFRAAYLGFQPGRVARFGEQDRARLLADAGIIRNRLKVDAAISNARTAVELGGLRKWLDANHPLTLEEWVKLFKKTFRFTGGEIVNSFLMSTGYLPGAHHEDCPVYKKVLRAKPKWASARNKL